MKWSAREALIISAYLLVLPSLVPALDLREAPNKISFSEEARAFGLTSGNLVVTDGDSAVAYNKRFKPAMNMSIKPDQRLTVSENGLHYGIASPYKVPDHHEEILHRLDIHDARGNVIWSLDGLAEGEYHISPSGDYIVFAAGKAGAYDWQVILCRPDQTATLLDMVSFKEIKFASDGSRFAIDGGSKGLQLYDKTGRPLLVLDYQNSFAMSSTGKYLAVFKEGTLSIYRDTSLLSKNDSVDREIAAVVISEKLNRLYYVSAFNLVVINVERGTRVWDYKTESAQYRFTSVDLSVDHQFVACGVIVNLGARIPKGNRHPKGYIYMFDVGRNIIRKAEFSNSGWTEGQPQVGFWPDQRTILVRTNDRILTFEMI